MFGSVAWGEDGSQNKLHTPNANRVVNQDNIVEKAQKCQDLGGVWVNDMCVVDLNENSHADENHGIGFGLSKKGFTLFYDYNLLDESYWLTPYANQIHIEYISGSEAAYVIPQVPLAEASYTLSYFSLRRKFDPGWYAELGYGMVRSNFQYGLGTYTASGSGSILTMGGGWQGDDFYYFHIGVQSAYLFNWSDDYDENKIPENFGERSVSTTVWSRSKNFSGLKLGFGWYLMP